MRLGNLHFQSGGFVEEKSMLSVLGIEMQSFGRPPCNLVSALTDWTIQVPFSELVTEWLAYIQMIFGTRGKKVWILMSHKIWVISFLAKSKVSLGNLHFQSGGFVEEKNMLSVLRIELESFGRPPGNLVSALTDWTIQVPFS